MKPKLLNIDHIHVFVSDRQEALDWYNNIFGLQPSEKIISLPQSGPIIIRNDEDSINIAIFKGEPQGNRSVIAFSVTGEEFINFYNTIRHSLNDNLKAVDHSSQFSIYFEDPYGNPYEVTSYDYEMLYNHYNTD